MYNPGPAFVARLSPNYRGSQCSRSCVHAKSLQSCLILCDSMDQVPLSMGFSRQEYWSGLPCLPPGNLPDPGIKPMSLTSPALPGRFFTTSTIWEAWNLSALISGPQWEYNIQTTWLSLWDLLRYFMEYTRFQGLLLWSAS